MNQNIVILYSGDTFYNKTSGDIFLYQILENCKGIELYKYVERNFGKYDIFFVKNTIKNIMLGVKYIHKKKVIHNDLKLENIIVETNGNIKIIDFGISIYAKNRHADEKESDC